jgi:S1-C subfamily serine protease
MRHVLVLGMLLASVPGALAGQALTVLHIKVVLTDGEQNPTPVPRHALLISDNPSSAPPRRIVTRVDGTADVELRPGSYTVESDRPVSFNGKAYQWTQIIRVVAGHDSSLNLTSDNAEVGPAASGTTGSDTPLEADPSFLLPRWQDSVAAVWTPTSHASGFIVDAGGLLATTQRAVGAANAVEVQLGSGVKVAATVVASNAMHDVAVLWIDPKVITGVAAVSLPCSETRPPAVAAGQDLFTIGVPLRQPKNMTSGTVARVEAHEIVTDFSLPAGSAGGPVFTARGELVGITSQENDDRGGRGDSRVLRSEEACGVLASAREKTRTAVMPGGTRLPVEPVRPFPPQALKSAAERRGGSLSPYQLSASTFDLAFITPVMTYGAQLQAEQASRRERDRSPRSGAEPPRTRQLLNFGNWSDYVGDFPPVLLIRVTPKLVEGFWTTVARGAARTQGVAIPPIKHFKAGFLRLRAFCGDAEVTPIHPFKIEQRVSETDAMYEGLYVFDPGALGPLCGAVKLQLYSEKEPDKPETRVVDPAIVEEIWQDFAPYRAQAP